MQRILSSSHLLLYLALDGDVEADDDEVAGDFPGLAGDVLPRQARQQAHVRVDPAPARAA